MMQQTFNRREVIQRLAIMLGGTIALPDILHAWETPSINNLEARFSPAQEALIAEIAEMIIPTTDTPGAKAAGVPQFIQTMIADCTNAVDRELFLSQLAAFDAETKKSKGKDFIACDNATRTELLKEQEKLGSKSFFPKIKSLTVTGFFTSEIGATKVLRYEAVPGRYDGAAPYKKGDKTWATD
jgi:Gluconate 2-dehydrogenase subunit 3